VRACKTSEERTVAYHTSRRTGLNQGGVAEASEAILVLLAIPHIVCWSYLHAQTRKCGKRVALYPGLFNQALVLQVTSAGVRRPGYEDSKRGGVCLLSM